MRFRQAFPAGPPLAPEERYTGLELAARAGADRPYVVCNFVASADGKSTAGGRTRGLADEPDHVVFQLLRTQVDALLAGTGTLRTERYGPPIADRRLAEIRIAEGRPAQPLAVVISRSGDVPFDIALFADPSVHVALYAPAATSVPQLPAQVTHHPIAHGHAELDAVMRSLRRDHEVRALLCEGGPRLLNALLDELLVDELFLTISPMLVGGGELPITDGGSLVAPQSLQLVWVLECDGSLFLRYSRREQR